MNTPLRTIRTAAIALAFGGLLANCSGGGSGGSGVILRLFFGINGRGSCDQVIVDVDLAGAQAVIARHGDGSVDCVLNQVLDTAGCDVEFTEIDNGDRLRVTIDGCTIPAVTNLFVCGFTDVDLSELSEEASALCACHAACDQTPPVCISPDPDPRACEDCDNGVDDDDNGLTDCEDPNCQNSNGCVPDTSTTTTSASITITTSTVPSSTTTTTIGTGSTTTEEPFSNCTIRYRLASQDVVGSMQWRTDYSAAPGEFAGTGSAVKCKSLVTGALVAFEDKDVQREIIMGIVSLDGLTGPASVAECKFAATSTPAAQDFVITVEDATNPDLEPIDPDIEIESIDCAVITTTTLEGPTTTVGGPTTTIEGGTTTTTLPLECGSVLFTLDESSAGLGALQFTVDYTAAGGDFQDEGASVVCASLVDGALFAPNDDDANHKLTLGLIALTPFSAPANLVQCCFSASQAPTPADFVITINDSADIDGNPVTVTIGAKLITP